MSRRLSAAAPLLAAAIACASLVSSAAPASAQAVGAEGRLTLARALELARARSPEAAIARSESDEAKANARLAGAPFRPEAYVTTTPGWSSGLPVAVAGQVPALAGISVRTTLYDVARLAEERSSAAEAVARLAAVVRADIGVARAVVSAYARVESSRERVETARRVLAGRESIFRRVSAMKSEGRATELDASRAELDVLQAKQRLLDRTLGADLDALELRRMIDWPADAPLSLADDPLASVPAPPPSGNLEIARTADPESRALDQQVDELSTAARIRTQLFQPSVVAEAQYLRLASYNHFDQYFVKFKADDFSVALAVSIPVWTGGRSGAASAAARARLERAEAARRARARDLELVVRRAEAELARTSAQAGVARSAESVARESLRIAQALAAEGRGGPSDVELAEIGAAQAREDTSNAEAAELAARLTLRELRGEPPVGPER